MTDIFPDNMTKYSETPLFTQDTVPAALLQDHQTKKGVWGRIVVQSGTLIYRRQGHPPQEVSPDHAATIFPEDLHSVEPRGTVAFRVEFYRADTKGRDL
ncbi:hypothetical protein RUESEDTHA_03913 [Ruegeria sp. THAF57]|uniref:DUF1971 domain-containing protein n=1 Tax=Ruegeria sp. THAF57 TaxID=2744555 RepID=UPI0015E039FA|nr:DUF1971 domain-containing protein [Ruegeria sp. THAF57]CAD0187002.1 hypothetical protein RUESEDTHA_03913 [Ruegeria sp. THAF57]